ncbi:thioredoxin domain-containing protein [Sphingomonas sabuli]|uniref:Thioredoxin domain-containing protein n=1 Tax=Sphingomonas sabuli TaxID=2764186 RepID=A0A7G9L062_9SPHN|nr:thioredoxin domain-containing protein [Sphingomonas sabuli]QNM82011.1 thioredoxin domain-containing protein [Sphingomonas sabuli]
MTIATLFRRGALCAALFVGLAAAVPTAVAAQAAREVTKADFYVPGIAPTRAPKGYDVTVVYFTDYQCPVCRQHSDDVLRAFAEDRKLRVIFRDSPIFGAQSLTAARLATAAHMQGKYVAFHTQLMRTKGKLTDARIREAADLAGVDWARLQKDLAANASRIDALVDWNNRLSKAGGISGTPAFVIGEVLADGGMDYASLKAEIADARARIVRAR